MKKTQHEDHPDQKTMFEVKPKRKKRKPYDPREAMDGITRDTPIRGSQIFARAWDSWIEYRKERGKGLTKSSAAMQIGMLEKYSIADAVNIIRRSIMSGWLGLFPPEADRAVVDREKLKESQEALEKELEQEMDRWHST